MDPGVRALQIDIFVVQLDPAADPALVLAIFYIKYLFVFVCFVH
jgi:hypothetical protein